MSLPPEHSEDSIVSPGDRDIESNGVQQINERGSFLGLFRKRPAEVQKGGYVASSSQNLGNVERSSGPTSETGDEGSVTEAVALGESGSGGKPPTRAETETAESGEELPPLSRIFDTIVEKNNLPFSERSKRENLVPLLLAYRQFRIYAERKHINQWGNPELIRLEDLVDKYDATFPEEVREHFYEMDRLEDKLLADEFRVVRYSEMLAKDERRTEEGRPKELSVNENLEMRQKIQELQTRIARFQGELTSRKQQIEGKVGEGVVDRREEYRRGFKEKLREEEINIFRQISEGIQGWKVADVLESEFVIDRVPSEAELESITRGFRDIVNEVHRQETLNPNLEENNNLEDAYREIELMFYKAHRWGITQEIFADMDHFYETFRGKFDDPRVRSEMVSAKNSYIASLLDEGARNNMILKLMRRGVSLEDAQQATDLQVYLVNRAFTQMENQRKQVLGEEALEVERLEWEWSLPERRLVLQERQRRQYFDNGMYIQLPESSKDLYLLAIQQYVDHIISGSGRFDTQEVVRKMGMLGEAIDRHGDGFMSIEARKELRNTTEVQLYLYLAYFYARIGQIEYFTAIMEAMADKEGTDRLQALIKVLGAKAAKMMVELDDPKNILFFRPEGHRGQLNGSKISQDLLRECMKEKIIEESAEYELDAVDEVEKERIYRRMAIEEMTEDELRSLFTKKDWEQKIKAAEDVFTEAKARLAHLEQEAPQVATQDRVKIWRETRRVRREARQASLALATLKERRDKAKVDTRTAFELIFRYFECFGRSAKLGAPSFIMRNTELDGGENGDWVRVDDAVYFYKFAILTTARQASRTVKEMRQQSVVEIREGKPGYGLSQEELDAFFKAVRILHKYGYSARWDYTENGLQKNVTFEEILKDPHFLNRTRHIPNNFLAIDHPIRNILASLIVRKEFAKKRHHWIERVLNIIDPWINDPQKQLKNRVDNQQAELDMFVDAIEDSRSFHYMVWRLAHGVYVKDFDQLKDLNLSTANIAFGLANMPLALKRLLYAQAYWMTNLREKVSRAAYIVPDIPLHLPSFDEAVGAKNMLETVQIIKKGAYDIYEILRWLFQVKDASVIKKMVEGDIDEKQGKLWGLLEKPLRNATKLWTLFTARGVTTEATYTDKEKIVTDSLSIFQDFEQVAVQVEKMLANDRGAAGSGAGIEEIQKFWNVYVDWIYSTASGGRRFQGGLKAYAEARYALEKFRKVPFNTDEITDIAQKETLRDFKNRAGQRMKYSDEQINGLITIMQEIFRRVDPSHNPGR